MNSFIELNSGVKRALADRSPVVALESTIITHGMPWPDNLKTARAVEQAVRDGGATPATIAVMGGRLRVGLEDAELEALAKTGVKARKCSRRDLALALQSGETGATTVAATMIVAHLAGIRVFATGGIGGVHRGAAETMDISADLQELARTPVAVVCAGPKAILDVGLTREYLETRGVPVIGYRTDELPAFYTRGSEYTVDVRLDSATAIAEVLDIHWTMGLDSGVVVANPVPKSAALGREEVDAAISTALDAALRHNVTGADLTPFLLGEVERLTEGRSLAANVALVVNNARLGAEIASALA